MLLCRNSSNRLTYPNSNKAEQDVFKRLSIFRGGFRQVAAERVAGASLPTLATLVDKSLLRWEPDGRYQIHELLRQYAAQQLAQSAEAVTQVYEGKEKALEMLAEAGFNQVEVHQLPHDFQNYYFVATK